MTDATPHVERPLTRRDALVRGGAGFGGVALSWLLANEGRAADSKPADPLAAKPGHHHGKAKSVIFLFMEGGPSHIDLFDPKPELNKLHGQKLPKSFKPVILAMGENEAPLMGCKRSFKQHGRGGLWFSDWLPHMAGRADDLAVVRSCWADGINHSGGVCQMNTGSILAGRPSLGSWVSYGLGTENTNLPAFVVMQDTTVSTVNGPRNWGAGFMPAAYQGTRLGGGREPIPNLHTPAAVGDERQQQKLEFLAKLNRRHADARPEQTELDARINAYELAFRMQAEAPGAVDLAGESAETLALYGVGEKETDGFGRQCLLARRLVERGVRFVQLYHGSGSKWDSHSELDKNHSAPVPGHGQAGGRTARRPEANRPAGQHPRRVGRGVRPHAAERAGQRPRPQPLRLHHADGRGRRAGRPGVRGDRRPRAARRRGPAARPRPARDVAAPDGGGPHEAGSTSTRAGRSGRP